MINRKLTRRDIVEAGLTLLGFISLGVISFGLWYSIQSCDFDIGFSFIGGLVVSIIATVTTLSSLLSLVNLFNPFFCEKAWYLYTNDEDFIVHQKKPKGKKKK